MIRRLIATYFFPVFYRFIVFTGNCKRIGDVGVEINNRGNLGGELWPLFSYLKIGYGWRNNQLSFGETK